MAKNYRHSNQNVYFRITSPTVNLELKYIWYHKLFNDIWTLTSIFGGQAAKLNKIARFLNEKYPALHSLLDLEIDKAEHEWLHWLNDQGNKIKFYRQVLQYGAEYTHNNHLANFLRYIHSNLYQLTDNREEWEKDRWDVRILHERYGIYYNKSSTNYLLDFTNIKQVNMDQHIKKYIKHRLLSKSFSWSSARRYILYLSRFIAFIFSLEPTWRDLKGLKRSHIERYIQWLHEYTAKKLMQKNAHSENYILEGLLVIRKFLEDIQRYEYDIAPMTHVRKLLFPEDMPKLRKKSIEQIDYIPEYVLEQLFTYLNELNKNYIPVVWVAFKTGLRISDVLGLTADCLVKLNGKYSIVTDIEKMVSLIPKLTFVKDSLSVDKDYIYIDVSVRTEEEEKTRSFKFNLKSIVDHRELNINFDKPSKTIEIINDVGYGIRIRVLPFFLEQTQYELDCEILYIGQSTPVD
ncbi:hypothetical protein [Paenibacillus kribbensis]